MLPHLSYPPTFCTVISVASLKIIFIESSFLLLIYMLNASLADSFFEPGDEISLSGLTLDGYVTQSGTRLLVSIPVGKRLDKITGARTSLATGVVRQNGNYIVGSASDSHGFAQDQGTFLLMKDLGIIRYQYDFSGAPSKISNNDVMSIHFTAGTIQLL